jgi:hypothetical protein
MKVIGGGSAKVMMATLDTVYMSYDRQHPPVPGERLVVYAPAEEVKSIKDGKTLGYVVQIMGEVDVESLAREAAEGTLMTTYNPVERGYRVGPLRRVFRRVEQQQAQVSASGLIVATLTSSGPIPIKTRKSWRARENHVLVGEENFAVTNLGISSGVRVGNVLEVVRKGDEYTTKRVFHIPYEDGWPRRVVGTILVIEAQAGTSLGVVTYSTRELERGDHVELRGRSQAGQNARAGDTGARGQVEGEAEVETGSGKAKAKGSFKFGGD